MLWQATFSFHISVGCSEELNISKPQDAATQAGAGEAEDVPTLVYNTEEKHVFLSPWHRLGPLRAQWLSVGCQWSNKCSGWPSAEGKLHCSVLPQAREVSGGELGGCSSQPWSITSSGVPRPPHPKPPPGDQAPRHLIRAPTASHSPSGIVLPVLWNSREMQGLKWVIHGFRQSRWHSCVGTSKGECETVTQRGEEGGK